jgi:chaperonin GroES
MKITPIGKRVLVKPAEAPTATASGFFIGVAEKEKTNHGVVIAVGSEVESVDVQNKVIYSPYAGTEVAVGEENMIVLNLEDIIAIVD